MCRCCPVLRAMDIPARLKELQAMSTAEMAVLKKALGVNTEKD
jgi:hypothetical protein